MPDHACLVPSLRVSKELSHSSLTRCLEFYLRAITLRHQFLTGSHFAPVAMAGEIFGCQNWRGVTSIQWTKARDAAERPRMNKKASTTETYQAQDDLSARLRTTAPYRSTKVLTLLPHTQFHCLPKIPHEGSRQDTPQDSRVLVERGKVLENKMINILFKMMCLCMGVGLELLTVSMAVFQVASLQRFLFYLYLNISTMVNQYFCSATF